MDIGAQIDIFEGMVDEFGGDVIVTKYASRSGGLDRRIMSELKQMGYSEFPKELGQARAYPAPAYYKAKTVLIVATVSILDLGYPALRTLGHDMLAGLSELETPPQHIATTLHGVNTGRGNDEVEAFRSILLGFADAYQAGRVPASLQRITFVERETFRASLMQNALEQFFPPPPIRTQIAAEGVTFDDAFNKPVADESTPHIFVAMPFDDDFDDHYYLAIRPSITDNGPLCIRLDQDESVFTGDIMEQVKGRIREAQLVIALLDNSNPNVYLEVGYAWGVGTPVILVLHENEKPPFDVQGARLLLYKRIHQLKDLLTKEIRNLIEK